MNSKSNEDLLQGYLDNLLYEVTEQNLVNLVEFCCSNKFTLSDTNVPLACCRAYHVYKEGQST
jgi:hypothetical protein